MSVNTYQINLSVLNTDDAKIKIPISMDNQIVEQSEVVQRVFVDTQTQASINPIVDYEKVRYTPLDDNDNQLNQIVYNVIFSGTSTTYADLGFTDDEVKYENNTFLNSFLELYFYDSDNPMVQNLLFFITLYSELKPSDLNPNTGWPKPANQIPVNYLLQNPYLNPRGVSEGYYLYDYRDELALGESKYLYMRGAFKNAKDGTTTNLMVVNTPQSIDNLVHQLYTRVKLTRTDMGFHYELDDMYQGIGVSGPNNVTYSTNQGINQATVNLYKIKAI